MCFTDDYDWYADVHEQANSVIEEVTKCKECRREMQPGTEMVFIYQQQHEECQKCEYGECGCEDGKCCQCEEPSYGETFDTVRCVDCDKFLQAVEEAEKESGCGSLESRPPLTEMMFCIHEGGEEEAQKYWDKSREMFPERNEYLDWLWVKIFGEEGE